MENCAATKFLKFFPKEVFEDWMIPILKKVKFYCIPEGDKRFPPPSSDVPLDEPYFRTSWNDVIVIFQNLRDEGEERASELLEFFRKRESERTGRREFSVFLLPKTWTEEA